MFDFRLSDEGEIELADIGGATYELIMEKSYSELSKATSAVGNDEGADLSPSGHQQIREAVELERTRLWKSQPRTKEAGTGLGRDIQKQMGAASVVVDRIVRQSTTKLLQSIESKGKKPN